MRLDPAGLPFVSVALTLALVGWVAVGWPGAALFLIAAAFLAFFFRDPDRQAPSTHGAEAVLAPADGRVLVAGPAEGEVAPAGNWLQISIFLSPLDVHVNRVPVSGRVTHVDFIKGRFLPAYRKEAASVNERSEIWIDHRDRLLWPARLLVCWRGASCAGCSLGQRCTRGSGSAS